MALPTAVAVDATGVSQSPCTIKPSTAPKGSYYCIIRDAEGGVWDGVRFVPKYQSSACIRANPFEGYNGLYTFDMPDGLPAGRCFAQFFRQLGDTPNPVCDVGAWAKEPDYLWVKNDSKYSVQISLVK